MTSPHDSKHFISLVEESKKLGTVTKILDDGAYDTKDNFSYLYHENIIPGIKTQKKFFCKYKLLSKTKICSGSNFQL